MKVLAYPLLFSIYLGLALGYIPGLRMSRASIVLTGAALLLALGSGILSALFLNDTIALILTPLVLNLCQSLSLNPIPYLLALAGATNVGSVATLTGNPQNNLIGSFSRISYLEETSAF